MKTRTAQKATPIAVLISALGCPVCFPILAQILSIIGISISSRFEGFFIILTQIFVLLSLFFAYQSFQRTRKYTPFIISCTAVAMIFLSLYVYTIEIAFSIALALLIGASIANYFLEKKVVSCSGRSCERTCA